MEVSVSKMINTVTLVVGRVLPYIFSFNNYATMSSLVFLLTIGSKRHENARKRIFF